jgi:hypothetical protein
MRKWDQNFHDCEKEDDEFQSKKGEEKKRRATMLAVHCKYAVYALKSRRKKG